MKLGSAVLYAILATIQVASAKGGTPVRMDVIAKRLGIKPNKYLERTLRQLVLFRILDSIRGRGGGFVLTRPSHRITLLEIIEVIGGPLHEEPYLRAKPGAHKKSIKKLAAVRSQINTYARSRLSEITVKQLVG